MTAPSRAEARRAAAASVPVGRARPVTGVLPPRRWALDLGATALLLAVGIIGFAPTFDGPGYLVAAVGAALLGLGIASIGTLLRWGILAVSGATVVGYAVFGGALALPATTIAGVIPTLETFSQLAIGVVTSWKRLLTTVAPVAGADGHLLVPFLLTLVAAVLTASIALRTKRPAWALVPAGGFLATEIALGMSQPALPIVQGIAFALVAVVWLAVRQAWAPSGDVVSMGEDAPKATGTGRRVIAAAAILGIAAGAGIATGAFATPTTRYVLRDVVIPPFDVREYPSPLQAFRGYVRDDRETPLFTVTGLPADARIRLATLDAYNGTVYNVSNDGAGASSAFTPVRSNMSPEAQGTPVTLRVEVEDLAGVWVPTSGSVTSLTFDGKRADDLRRSAHYNEGTGTAVATSRLVPGDSYTIEAKVPSTPTDEALADKAFAPITLPKQTGIPEELAGIAAKTAANAASPIEQVRALQTWLSETGFFSHGLEGEAQSRSGHNAGRIETLLGSDQMVGDDEQYAVAMALMATQIGIPARVVMGFHPDADAAGAASFTATGDNLHAWVEVAFEDVGWVPFDPTPPEDQIPNDQSTRPRADPQPQVLQPPPPAQEPVDLPPTVADDQENEEDPNAVSGILGVILAIGGLSLGVFAVIAAPLILIAALKARRRARRLTAERPADRVSGGWDELVDRATDLGAPVAGGATRSEDAALLGSAFAEPAVTTLARDADAVVFGPGDPSPDDVAEFWRQVDGLVAEMAAGTTRMARFRARWSLRSLRSGRRR